MPMDAVTTAGLSKTYHQLGRGAVHSVRDLDLVVGGNEIYGFLGRNGAGKTTTIKMLCGLVQPTAGEARLFGKPARDPAARAALGYLPEQPYFYEYLTPRETVRFYGRLRGMDDGAIAALWDRAADLLDLGGVADRRIRGFSKGMRQRVGFAVALVGDPPLLVLDEPMSGLDPLGRRMVRELIVRLRKEEGKTIFFSSHVLGDVEEICDRVGILVDGRLVFSGGMDDLPGRDMKRTELRVAGLSRADAADLAARAAGHAAGDGGDTFTAADGDAANALAAEALRRGGRLLEFRRAQESLEDVFTRMQHAETTGGARP
ncbi:MAG TPA: ABC transporter ATP-binding protein [Candidatus Hydrogenedentes bacterium]|nr:ABC transporter ATP-binding protein [Candidatus Hydrogenedentota bacterium]